MYLASVQKGFKVADSKYNEYLLSICYVLARHRECRIMHDSGCPQGSYHIKYVGLNNKIK